MLVAAFRATLEEVLEADVIVHVRDISQVDSDAQKQDVETVLRQLGLNPSDEDRIIEVWNKIDRFDASEQERLANIATRQPEQRRPMLVSAVTGQGTSELLMAIETRLAATKRLLRVTLDSSDGEGMSWLYRHTEVLNKDIDDERVEMTVRAEESRREAILHRFAGRVTEAETAA
jgi:GTP-binding protein HflX